MTTPKSDVHRHFAAYFKSNALEPYLFYLSKSMSEGHICITLNDKTYSELAAFYPEAKRDKDNFKIHPLVSDGSKYTPFVIKNDKLYMQRYFQYESLILNKIKALIEYEASIRERQKQALKQHQTLIANLFPTQPNLMINWQGIAALSAVLNQFTIITGGPGTGKTTTVAKILTLMYALQPTLRVALAAPTGKAANRMANSLKNTRSLDAQVGEKIEQLVPSTIHRLLGSKRKSIYFNHNSENPVPFDLVIVDEASMIDISLFSKLLDAIHPATKIILLGDKDQLSSVEAGSLFGDLCMAQSRLNVFSPGRVELFKQLIPGIDIPNEYIEENQHLLFEHIIELKYSHRFSGDDGIGKFSKAIIQSSNDVIESFYTNIDEKVTIDFDYSEAIFQQFISGYKEYIQESDIEKAFEKLAKLRVLCAVREGNEGVIHINENIEKYLQSQGFIHKDTEFYEHRPILITKNNYELGLYNGDIGIARKDEKGNMKIWFETNEDKLTSVIPASIDAAETVFAMTIHKSQGSEFDKVMVLLPKQEELALLTRELLYTAVTRAKEYVLIQGTKDGIMDCAGRSVQRGSGLIDRLVEMDTLNQ